MYTCIGKRINMKTFESLYSSNKLESQYFGGSLLLFNTEKSK